ncbi:MAG: 30S ribosomal protein S6 [Sphingopyxis sp.]|nr:30S ribosomal protein S6 [Sphingopyxis sp.]
MPFYEHVFIARQDLSQTQVDALAETATKVVTDDFGGKVLKTETWGLKQLAYKMEKNRKGHYAMLAIEAPGAAVAELERQAAISEDIIRWLTIRVDELEAGPSVMMRKGSDRGGRGRGRDRDGEE